MYDDDEDPLDCFYRFFKTPSQAQLLANAEEIGKVGKEIERITMYHYSNNAHPSVDALMLAWEALLLAEMTCLAGRPMPGQLRGLRGSLEQLEWRLGEGD